MKQDNPKLNNINQKLKHPSPLFNFLSITKMIMVFVALLVGTLIFIVRASKPVDDNVILQETYETLNAKVLDLKQTAEACKASTAELSAEHRELKAEADHFKNVNDDLLRRDDLLKQNNITTDKPDIVINIDNNLTEIQQLIKNCG